MTEIRTRGVGRDVAIYGLASLVTQGAVLIATPFLARKLEPEGYGQFELLLVGMNLLSLFALTGVDTAALQQYYVATDRRSRKQVFSTGLAWTATTGVLSGLFLLLMAKLLSTWVFGGSGFESSIRIAAVTLPIMVVSRFTLEALRAERLPWRYLCSVGLASVCQTVLAVVLLTIGSGGVGDVMAAWLVASVLALTYNLTASRGVFSLSFERDRLVRLLRLGVPLLITGLAGWSVMFIDRLVLVRFVSLSDLGVYALAGKVALVLTLVIYSFNRAWTPYGLELHSSDPGASRSMRALTLPVYLATVAWLAVGASLLAPFVVAALGGSGYDDAIQLIPVLAGGFLLLAPLPVVQLSMLIGERTAQLAWPAVTAGVVNFVLCVVLAARYGLMGAAWATVAGFLVQLVLVVYLADRLDHVPYPWGRLGTLAGLTVGSLAVAWSPDGFGWGVARIAVIALFPLSLLVLGVVKVDELRLLRSGARGVAS